MSVVQTWQTLHICLAVHSIFSHTPMDRSTFASTVMYVILYIIHSSDSRSGARINCYGGTLIYMYTLIFFSSGWMLEGYLLSFMVIHSWELLT